MLRAMPSRLCLEDCSWAMQRKITLQQAISEMLPPVGTACGRNSLTLFGLISISTNAPECCGGTTGIGTILLGRFVVYLCRFGFFV